MVMIEQVHWYERTPRPPPTVLQGGIEADVVVVGGGMTGLAAAEWLHDHAGRNVVLLESTFCGGGATGRSSGFMTPDSELQVTDLVRRFGADEARRLWTAAHDACEHVRGNIERLGIACDLVQADCLYLGAGRGGLDAVRQEHAARERLGLDTRFYLGRGLRAVLGSDRYTAGVRYGRAFAIDPHAYAQGMKAALLGRGVRIFEETPAVTLARGRVETPRGSVSAPHVVVCLDRYARELGMARDTWHAQTFLIVSEPLDRTLRESLFPDGPILAWDSDLIYQYFRLTGDGRLLVGGGTLRETYARAAHDGRTPKRLEQFIRKTFPVLADVRFESYWPGLIGVTRDLLPLAGASREHPGFLQAMCAAGLPWSVLAGQAAARAVAGASTDLDAHFSPARHFELAGLASILPLPLSFALSHLYNKHAGRKKRSSG
jgi:gamma-glutamylputrescine oxidase